MTQDTTENPSVTYEASVRSLTGGSVYMTIYLDECQAGCDASDIGFPHVLLCMAVVLQTQDKLYGFHFDEPTGTNTNEYAGALFNFIRRKGGDVANGVRLYGCCNHAVRYEDRICIMRAAAWRTEMQQIAAKLGYRGLVSGFDASIIHPANGTYIQFHREDLTNRCRIYYKRHEKMAHISVRVRTPPGTGNVETWKPTVTQLGGGTWGWNNNLTVYADLDRANGATTWHELNYFLRQTTFQVP